MDDEQGVEALRRLRPRTAFPIHHGDYGVFRSPVSDFLARCARGSLETEVRPLERGRRTPLASLAVAAMSG